MIMYWIAYITCGISEMNDHNITSNGEEELEIICHKLPVLEWSYIMPFESDLGCFNKCIL